MMKQIARFGLLLVILFLCGCFGETSDLDLGREVETKGIWMDSRFSSSPSSWLHLNFYQQSDNYPEYGIAIYSYDSTMFQHTENEYFEDALRMIRHQFGDAYRSGSLKEWSSEQGKPIPWEMKHVVILMNDHGLENWKENLGVIIPASQLFDEESGTSEFVKNFKLKRGAHRNGSSGYPIIETHRKGFTK